MQLVLYCYLKYRFTLTFFRQKLDSIFFYNGVQGFSKFLGPLPAGLKFTMTNSDVVKMLGEPEGKPPNNLAVPIFVDYKKRGLQIDFFSRDYNDIHNPITCIAVYKPSA